jgi:hypothetical protein
VAAQVGQAVYLSKPVTRVGKFISFSEGRKHGIYIVTGWKEVKVRFIEWDTFEKLRKY